MYIILDIPISARFSLGGFCICGLFKELSCVRSFCLQNISRIPVLPVTRVTSDICEVA